ncbi:MAG: YcxB family protein [Ruminococcus sp.]|nr:YcxB family protein [Ruminococcus sp.]HRR77973.1 YcxB family protein [Ruminococcus sp.]
MEETYKLEKEYTVKPELFSKAYKEYQKKFVMKKSYIFMALFLILAADFVYAAVKAPENRLVYLLIVVCIAFAFREWHNPRFVRRRLTETVRDLGEPVYSIGVAESFIDISTVKEPEYESEVADISENAEKEEKEEIDLTDIPDELDPLPEKTRIELDENYQSLEYDDFFLLMQGKQTFYILPKEGFTEPEMEIIRNTGK